MNERQFAVLTRVAEGDDLSSPDGVASRRSASALADRGLLAISRRGGVWRATITPSGRHYLKHGHHPDNPAFTGEATGPDERPSGLARRFAKDNAPRRKTSPRRTATATVQIKEKRRTAAIELIAKLEDKSQILMPVQTGEEESELRRVIDFAKRHNLVPVGKRIEKLRMYGGRVRIRLIEGAHPNTKPAVKAPPIAVPDEVSKLHPLLAGLSAPANVLGVSTGSLPRALRIMHALLIEAERRGYEVGWSADTSQGVEIRINDVISATFI